MRRALGKGLAQLMPSAATTPAPEKTAPAAVKKGSEASQTPREGILEVSVDLIRANEYQPRNHYDQEALAELGASVRAVGIIQPLVVRKSGDGFELIAGERRLRAAKLAGLARVPVVLRNVDNQRSLEMALIENIQREDLSAIEAARAYRELMDQFKLSQEDVAQRVGKSRAAVSNTLRLLRLPDEVQFGIENGLVSEGQVRPLVSLESEARQLEIYRKILEQGLSARQVEALVRAAPLERPLPQIRFVDPNIRALEEGLSMYFGSPTSINRGKAGGKLVVDFYSDEDLQRILDLLGVGQPA